MSANRVPPKPAGLPKGSPFGEELRRAREARGVALEAITEATRISRRHLDALERSDLDALPPGPFGNGYIRAYAKALGIDPGPILDSYRAQERQRGHGTAEGERQMLDQLSHLVGRRAAENKRAFWDARTAGLAAAVVALVVIGVVGWPLIRARAQKRSVASSPPAAARVSPELGASRPPQPRKSRAPGRTVKTAAPTPAAPRRAVPTADVSAPAGAPAAAAAARGATAAAPGVVAPPQTERPSSPEQTAQALKVSDHGVGTDLADHRLVGRSDRFPEGTRVTFWNLVVGGQRGIVIQHVWLRGERVVAKTDLPIGGAHWRTYSRIVLPPGSSGRWAVEARTTDGQLLARDEFLSERPEP